MLISSSSDSDMGRLLPHSPPAPAPGEARQREREGRPVPVEILGLAVMEQSSHLREKQGGEIIAAEKERQNARPSRSADF